MAARKGLFLREQVMPQYSVEAFRWSGTGYNATYNTSYTAVFDDDDPLYQGGADGNESVSINGGSFVATGGSPYVITINFTDVNGDPHTEEFYFFNAGAAGGWYFIPGPGSAFTVGATLGSYQSHYNGWDYATVTCFAAGTRIAVPGGTCPVEHFQVGDEVLCSDGRVGRLRQVLTRRLSAQDLQRHEKLRPVRITQGALGPRVPSRDLLVSRQHRILMRSMVAERMFGQHEVLVSAIRLTSLPGVFVDPAPQAITYVHLVLDRHELVLAEDTPSESFYPGEEAMRGLPTAAREEIETLFPALKNGHCPPFARTVPPLARQKTLVERVRNNGKAAIEMRP